VWLLLWHSSFQQRVAVEREWLRLKRLSRDN